MRDSTVAATFWAERQVRRREEPEGLTCVLHRADTELKLGTVYELYIIYNKLITLKGERTEPEPQILSELVFVANIKREALHFTYIQSL